MSYRVTEETMDDVFSLWRDPDRRISWDSLFVLPPWLKAWGAAFGSHRDGSLLAVWDADGLIGIAPYTITEGVVCFWGSGNVCDYLDVVAVPGRERELIDSLLEYLAQRRLHRLFFESLRSDSITMMHVPEAVASRGGTVKTEKEEVSLGLDLPRTWDAYLLTLSGKERHEVRRKMRRLHGAGSVQLRAAIDPRLGREDCDRFLKLFSANRTDKAEFMNDAMASFFRDVITLMAKEKFARLFFLELNGRAVAASLCFDYGSTRYLYNSGYDERFQYLSVGLLCNILTIKDGIDLGLKRYDFLKGAEPYKARLGGKPLQLYRCRAEM